jgi:hypothetical protein
VDCFKVTIDGESMSFEVKASNDRTWLLETMSVLVETKECTAPLAVVKVKTNSCELSGNEVKALYCTD